MIQRLSHIGIAVADLEKSLALYQQIFQPAAIHREVVPEQRVEVASFVVGGVRIELVAPTSPDSPIARFLEQRGDGIHHLAFESDDVAAELDRLAQQGIQLINATPTRGAHDMLIAFLHPKSTGGVLLELCQHHQTAHK
ncbi:MAG: methylmalonyl-CoA epimerase [Candidatus Kapaibacterium sp.]|nr:MAG: methylmalonyl-CoA epimerase [Candidatus Kapabacteria bacterium]